MYMYIYNFLYSVVTFKDLSQFAHITIAIFVFL